MRKIVIASDSFKGSLSSMEVAKAAAMGISSVMPDCTTTLLEIADGGEGTFKALTQHFNGQVLETCVSDPLGRKIKASYGMADINGRRTAIIEMAQASGLTLLTPQERTPLHTSTSGTGEMILDALGKGCRRFIIGIGGSATNDGGTGMLEALGFRFHDKDGQPMTGMCGGRLHEIGSIDRSAVSEDITDSEFIIACDVDTPFCGPEGAAAVFGPQKGATPDMVAELEKGMLNLNTVIMQTYGTDLSKEAGSGAAGGLGGGFKAFLGADLRRGIDIILDTMGFSEAIKGADLIITGEGRLDRQTAKGKVISGIISRAAVTGVPVITIAGIVELSEQERSEMGLAGAYPIGPRPENESDLEYAMRPEVASKRISETVVKVLESLSPSSFHESL